jgi:hypothetical protein
MNILKVQLIHIDLIEALARHLPEPAAGPLESIALQWRDKVNSQIIQEALRIANEIRRLRREITQMQSASRKLRDRPPNGR